MAATHSTNKNTPSFSTIDKKLAVLCERVSNSIEFQKRYSIKLDKHIEQAEDRLLILDKYFESFKISQLDNKEEINRLRNKSNLIDIIIALGTIIAIALGLYIK
jgi:hypothetical protein